MGNFGDVPGLRGGVGWGLGTRYERGRHRGSGKDVFGVFETVMTRKVFSVAEMGSGSTVL